MKETLPQGIELTALNESFRDDPYEILDRLRSNAPVHEDTQLKRWIFTTHDDVKSLLRDKELYSDPRKANPGTFTREFLGRDNEEPSMLLMDDPGHRRLRSLVTKPFIPAAVEKWRPRAKAVIQRILNLIGNSVKALLDNPEQMRKLRNHPDLIKNAVEEVLRFDSPVTNSGRVSNRDFEVGGCPVKKGESLMTSLAAANRDPTIYPDPNTFDIERSDTHHQSFGGGRHFCLGAHLARLEAQEAILAVLEKYPNLKHSDKGYEYATVPNFRGLSSLWVSNAQ